VLSSPDPNNPSNDGIDMSDVPRSSGSFSALYIDDENGLLHDEDGSEGEEPKEDEEEVEEEDCDAEDNNPNDDCREDAF
jgi:hypothetical protein